MLAFIKANYKAGDTIEIAATEGTFTGQIEYVTDKYIILRLPNGQICGISAANAVTFRADPPVAAGRTSLTLPEEAPADNEEDGGNERPEAETDDNADTGDKENKEIPVKVVGRIDLDKLQRIDPRLSQRRYFKNDYNRNEEYEGEETTDEEEGQHGEQENTFYRPNFVNSKGRVTYFNNEKRYGFIHEYETGNSLYFHLQQVVDSELYGNVRKGTKVTYTAGRNQQGYVARTVHLPKPFSEVLEMAEDELANRHAYTARDLVNHILDNDAQYQPALDLLEEINDALPVRGEAPAADRESAASATTQYMPSTLYAQAKRAFLNKDINQAEVLYKEAIEKGEKVETCVKDLMTLYVSVYKKTTEPEAKEAARQKATDFLKAHHDALPDTLTNKQFLALNFYLPLLYLEEFLELADEIMEDPQISGVVSRRVFYIWQKAIARNKLGQKEAAMALVEEGLQLAPHNRQLLNLETIILNPEEYCEEGADETADDKEETGNAAEEADTVTSGTEAGE